MEAPRVVAVSHGPPLKRSVRVGPAAIAHVEGGRPDAPPVVLLHGYPTHAFLWRHVVHELGDDVRSLAPDLPGLGDTVVSPYEDFSAPVQAELLVEWLDRLGLARVALVAHAHGGAVAHQVVATAPERISHLALVAVVAYDNWPVPYWDAGTGATWRPGWRRRLRTALARATATGGLDGEVLDELLRPTATPAGREAARRFLLAGRPTATLECVAALRRFERPSLVVWGADDPVLSPSWADRLAADLPGAAEPVVLDRCGHLVPEERPAALAAALRALLARPV